MEYLQMLWLGIKAVGSIAIFLFLCLGFVMVTGEAMKLLFGKFSKRTQHSMILVWSILSKILIFLLFSFIIGVCINDATAQSRSRNVRVNVSGNHAPYHITGPVSPPDQTVPHGFPYHHGGIGATQTNQETRSKNKKTDCIYDGENLIVYERKVGHCPVSYVDANAYSIAERRMEHFRDLNIMMALNTPELPQETEVQRKKREEAETKRLIRNAEYRRNKRRSPFWFHPDNW